MYKQNNHKSRPATATKSQPRPFVTDSCLSDSDCIEIEAPVVVKQEFPQGVKKKVKAKTRATTPAMAPTLGIPTFSQEGPPYQFGCGRGKELVTSDRTPGPKETFILAGTAIVQIYIYPTPNVFIRQQLCHSQSQKDLR